MDTPQRKNERSFKRHVVWTEGDDTVIVVWGGDVLAADIEVVNGVIQTLPDEVKDIVLIQDVRQMNRFTAEARKKVIERKDSQRVRWVLLVGASFHVRMILAMLSRAMWIVHKRRASQICVDSMEEARRFVEENREKRRLSSNE